MAINGTKMKLIKDIFIREKDFAETMEGKVLPFLYYCSGWIKALLSKDD